MLLFSLNYNLGATIYFRSLAFFHGRASAREGIFECFDGREKEREKVVAFTRFPRFLSRGREASGDAPRLATRLINDPPSKKPEFLPRDPSRQFPISIPSSSLARPLFLFARVSAFLFSSADIPICYTLSRLLSTHFGALYLTYILQQIR